MTVNTAYIRGVKSKDRYKKGAGGAISRPEVNVKKFQNKNVHEVPLTSLSSDQEATVIVSAANSMILTNEAMQKATLNQQ